MARESAPGYQVHESSASRRGLGFVVGNGERIPNEGQFVLNLDADNGQGSATQRACTFQVADLTRPPDECLTALRSQLSAAKLYVGFSAQVSYTPVR